jgi:hypothetical protein
VTLVIGEAERALIADLRAMAAANPFHQNAAQAAANKDIAAYRDMMRMHAVFLPGGFAVAYTQEYQPHAPPPGLCHHISISIQRPGLLPSTWAVEMILEAFGMQPLKASDGVWVENVSPGEAAVNVLQLVRP